MNALRDFMLKSPDSDRRGPYKDPSEFPSSSFPDRTPFSKVNETPASTWQRDTTSQRLLSVPTVQRHLETGATDRGRTQTGPRWGQDPVPPSHRLPSVLTDVRPSPLPDLDSAVSTGGLDQILSPPAGQTPNQPRPRSFFQSVTVTKVVKPDGVRVHTETSGCFTLSPDSIADDTLTIRFGVP